LATTAIIEDKENNFDKKLDLAIAGLQQYYYRALQDLANRSNALIIIDFLIAMKTEKNLSMHSHELIIKTLNLLSTFTGFKDWKAPKKTRYFGFS
jgi:hypothetical protein